MAVKYWSEEWVKEVNNRIQSDESVQNAVKGQSITVGNVISGTPDGDVKGYFRIKDGTPEVGLGEPPETPEATLKLDYDTAVAVAKGELQGQAAFMQGKLKIDGNMMKVMQLQGFMQQMGKVTEDIEVEY